MFCVRRTALDLDHHQFLGSLLSCQILQSPFQAEPILRQLKLCGLQLVSLLSSSLNFNPQEVTSEMHLAVCSCSFHKVHSDLDGFQTFRTLHQLTPFPLPTYFVIHCYNLCSSWENLHTIYPFTFVYVFSSCRFFFSLLWQFMSLFSFRSLRHFLFDLSYPCQHIIFLYLSKYPFSTN